MNLNANRVFSPIKYVTMLIGYPYKTDMKHLFADDKREI